MQDYEEIIEVLEEEKRLLLQKIEFLEREKRDKTELIDIGAGVIVGDRISAIEQKLTLDGICVVFTVKEGPNISLIYNDSKLCAQEFDRFVREWEGKE